ncbi:MAG: quinone-dependent dihydroorotate dehydrogenase [Chloroflexota bacterium]|nr:quinone-dependent dihydroorotate dehydrogenase [Chloroflexota bacterium]
MQRYVYKRLISPTLDRLDSETWHERARRALHHAEASSPALALVERCAGLGGRVQDERLRVTLAGVELENPVLVGAGWDKAGTAVRGLHALGFSGVEVGSVLEHPQPGNPKPRQFMLAPGVALNRLGFNSPGAAMVARNLEAYAGRGIPIGISLGKNREIEPSDAAQAHAAVARLLYRHAAYFAINVSSPNTPGLRQLQDRGPLTEIVQAVRAIVWELGGRTPMFVKIAPDLSLEAVDDVLQVALDNGVAGIIATNTTDNPEIKSRYGEYWRTQAGGLSGDDPEYRRLSTAMVVHLRREAGDRLEIIGVGGVKDAASALEKMLAGAYAVQVVTAIRGEGPGVAADINRGILHWMEMEGVRDLPEIVGAAV